ncbi:SNF2-related protein, partial [Desulfobacterales bacterium HSG17]|nr:SNF2-related protein [Desulfobacterales bacterium HSG17]
FPYFGDNIMINLTQEYIRKNIAYSDIIFKRGAHIYEHGAFACAESNPAIGHFVYDVDGTYGDYTAQIQVFEDDLNTDCDCPYPGKGCKHTVAVLLDVMDKMKGWADAVKNEAAKDKEKQETEQEKFLSPEEIKEQAVEDRKKRALTEDFTIELGDMYKGEHLVETPLKKQYQVTLHDPVTGTGHCSCPDFETSRLNTCKHLILLHNKLKIKRDLNKRMKEELFPFVDIFWDSVHELPRLFCERPEKEIHDIQKLLADYFDSQGLFTKKDFSEFLSFLSAVEGNKRVRIQEPVLNRLNCELMNQQLVQLSEKEMPGLSIIKGELYPYQKEGISFALYKRAALIGDEMGLGKTLQSIAIGILKKQIFGFEQILVITAASIKEQWKREIEKFSDEKAVIIAGSAQQRRTIYETDKSLFKITNYEAVLRDVTIISALKPDLVILDEAQRIKNFTTKTADAVKNLPRKHALVLTGTPLENKLEDVYSIVQFLDPYMLSPLWKFAGDHFMLSRNKKGKILGYHNLDMLQEKLKPIVIRRKKQEVLSDLPDEIVNNYFLELSDKQAKIHSGYLQLLMPLLNKKYLTPMDLRQIQVLLLKMRMVCNSTYLIDKKTNISPKLKELEGILDELVVENKRKLVIFSEWTTMTFLIAKYLSETNIKFVELAGKIPVKKRQALIDEFTDNPECKVFLSTDAGGTGLNLQAADCVINFELPWNPARMNQRIGRVSRIGQTSNCINVINLISKNSIEEKILAGIQLKTRLFEGVFEDGPDKVEFSHAKRTEMLNKLRELMGETALLPVEESRPGEEIPEDTPHFLNPEVMEKEEQRLAYEAEEDYQDISELAENRIAAKNQDKDPDKDPVSILEGQPPEKIENVLNSGMQFISGLMEMATGQKVKPIDEDDSRMVRIDKQSGEVTMKFKLPGF